MAAQNGSRKRSARSGTEILVRRILLAVLIVAAVCFGIYELYVLNQNPIRTFTARQETVCDTLRTTAFILRDEQSIQSDLSGYTVLFAQDGERVEANAQIAARFPDSGSAQRYAQGIALRRDYERYAALSTGREYSSMKVESLMKQAADSVCDFLQTADSGSVAAARQSESDFLDRETALEIAVGGSIDLSGKLAELSQKIQAQDAMEGAYETISTGVETGGYFFSETDGCEDVLDYGEVDSLTVEQLRSALGEKTARMSGGKIVKSHVWYIAAIIDTKKAEMLSDLKGSVRISFPLTGVQDVQTSVYRVNVGENGESVVVFRCIEVSEQLLRLRREEIDIVMDELTGFKVPNTAVRVIDIDGEQVRGVYVLRGNIVSFRRLNPVLTGKDFVLSAPSSKGNYIRQYDEIITGGKNLHDGAVVYI